MSLESVIASKEVVENKVESSPEFKGKMEFKEEAVERLKTFVYVDNIKKVLDIAMATGENPILHGPGGYCKSDYSLTYLNSLGIQPYIMTMGSGTTTDRLFGGVDIPTFNMTGKLEYLVENSFMAHEYVIFEELFDAPDYILEPLKDILSSGVFRNGSQIYPIKTKLIISCTNKTRTEFSKNNSLKALMERFPLETHVIWKDHNRITYENLLNTKMGFADPMLTYILEQFAVNGSIISPRIAIKAANIINECGPEALSYIADFSVKNDLLKTCIAKFNSLADIQNLIKKLAMTTTEYAKIDKTTLKGIQDGIKLNKEILNNLTKLKNIKADDSMVKTSAEAIKTYTEIHTKNKKDLEVTMMVDDVEEASVVSTDDIKLEEDPF